MMTQRSEHTLSNRFNPTITVTDDVLQVLWDACEYFCARSDADQTGVGCLPNKEMRLASEFKAMIDRIEGDLEREGVGHP